jgi:hypothetical protein
MFAGLPPRDDDEVGGGENAMADVRLRVLHAASSRASPGRRGAFQQRSRARHRKRLASLAFARSH